MNTRTYSSMGIPDLSPYAFGGDLPPFARNQMVKALGMHYEKSKGLGTVLRIAASIAIPMAAPAIAASIGLSTALAGTLGATAATAVGSAIVGAGLGAVSSLVTKQKIGEGMLFGAIGGGMAGYLEAANTAATAAQQAGTAQVGPAVDLGNSAATVAQAPVQAVGGVSVGAPVQAVGDVAQQTLGNTLSSSGVVDLSNSAVNLPNTVGSNFANLGATASPTSFYNPNAAQTFLPQASQALPTTGLQITPAAQQTAAAVQKPTNAFEALKARVSDPNMQADLVLRAAGQLAGSLTAGSGLSPEQEELVKQQKAELAMLQQTNRGLFEQRLREATGILGEAKYFDPNYFGMMEQRRVTTGIGRQAQENLRNIAPQRGGLRTAEQRRYNLEAATRGETAYLQGATTAQQNKLATTQAGLAALPTGGPSTYGSGGDFTNMLSKAEEQRRRANEDIGSLFGSLSGPSKSTSLG